MSSSRASVTAAGAVLWRPSKKHGIKIALIHRPRYDDWSLPKGKAEKGESIAATAAREVEEETGFTVRLGRRITTVTYRVSAGCKAVHYFSATARDGAFRANDEVDTLVWVPVSRARKMLSYRYDADVLDAFVALPPDLATVILVRHARAGRRDDFDGTDRERPLDRKGRAQADQLAQHLLLFAPNFIASAPLTRCQQTVHPLAAALGLDVAEVPALSEAEYQRDPAAARHIVTEWARDATHDGSIVACSQGGAIPGVIKSLASRSNLPLPTTATPKASYWLLSFDGKKLRQADRYLVADN